MLAPFFQPHSHGAPPCPPFYPPVTCLPHLLSPSFYSLACTNSHLVVARLCGIKVLRFSVGTGKPFYTKRWRNIEWCLALSHRRLCGNGGHARRRVAPEDLPVAFDKQHPLKRIAVVLAGLFTNLILAVLLYWFNFGVGGITQIRPYVGTVEKGIAAQAGFQQGDKIITNNKAVNNFSKMPTPKSC